MTTRITLEGGKYTYIQEDGRGSRALRYGEEWRDLTGDKFVGAMAAKIEELEEKLAKGDRDFIRCCEYAKD